MLTVLLYCITGYIWKNAYAPRRWREGVVVVNLFKKEIRLTRGTIYGDNATKHSSRQNIL